MASLDTLLENPHWAALRRYAFGPPNGGDADARWGVMGSVGGNSPMWLYSNEYGHLAMKHGQNDLLSYTGGIKNFAPSVTRHLQNQVHECSNLTLNSPGCQQSAIAKVYSHDAHRANQPRPDPFRTTSQPFNIPYHLGYPLQEYPTLPPYGPQS